jgi:hypothetical protein
MNHGAVPCYRVRAWSTLALAAIVSGCVATVVVGKDTGTPREVPACGPRSATQIVDEWKASARRGPPDCLDLHAPGPALVTTGPTTLTDTGLTRCRARRSDTVVECPVGFTIHIETRTCRPPDGEAKDGGATGNEGTAIVGFTCRAHHL